MKKILTITSFAAFLFLLVGGGIILVNVLNSQNNAPLKTNAGSNVLLTLNQVKPLKSVPAHLPSGSQLVTGINAANVNVLADDVQFAQISLKFDSNILTAQQIVPAQGFVINNNKIDNLNGTISFSIVPSGTTQQSTPGTAGLKDYLLAKIAFLTKTDAASSGEIKMTSELTSGNNTPQQASTSIEITLNQ